MLPRSLRYVGLHGLLGINQEDRALRDKCHTDRHRTAPAVRVATVPGQGLVSPNRGGERCGQSSMLTITPLLHEIYYALEKLLDSSEASVIDLMSLPMGPGDEDMLKKVLGGGEIEAQLHAMGRSSFRETGIAGVWWVEHFNVEDELIGKFLEISEVPMLLKSQPEDIRRSLTELNERVLKEKSI